MTSLVDFIEKPNNTENVPIEDIEVILKNVYAVIGNIMDVSMRNCCVSYRPVF